MSGLITLNIPLKPYLKKYLIQKYGDTHLVTKYSWLGRYLVDLLDKNYRKTNDSIKNDDYYPVIITSTIVNRVGFDISASKLKALADMISKVFLNDLYSYIEVSIGSDLKWYNSYHDSINKQNVARAIKQFLKHYQITEDELSSDTLYKNFYRECVADKKQIAEISTS